MKLKHRKGFTLIELLVVIAIIAVLSVVVILSLNPAELLRQARDSNRISDMATLKSALGLYLADVSAPFMGTTSNCYVGIGVSSSFNTPTTTGTWANVSDCKAWFVAATGTLVTSTGRGIGASSTSTAGNGWIPVNFSAISSGAPLGQEPVDPVNQQGTCTGSLPTVSLSSCGLFYSYEAYNTVFKLAAFMESTKYSTGTQGVQSVDGGLNDFVYEQGTNLAL